MTANSMVLKDARTSISRDVSSRHGVHDLSRVQMQRMCARAAYIYN